MGIWGLWESAQPQTYKPRIRTEYRETPFDRSYRYERRGRVGGAAESRRADCFKVARSSYQGQFVITVMSVGYFVYRVLLAELPWDVCFGSEVYPRGLGGTRSYPLPPRFTRWNAVLE